MHQFHFRAKKCGISRSSSSQLLKPVICLIPLNLFKIFRAYSCLFILSLSLVFSWSFLSMPFFVFLIYDCSSFNWCLEFNVFTFLYFLALCHNFLFHLFFDATDFIFFDATRNASLWWRCCCCAVECCCNCLLLQHCLNLKLLRCFFCFFLVLLRCCRCLLLRLCCCWVLAQISTFPRDVLFCEKSVVAIHMTTPQSLLFLFKNLYVTSSLVSVDLAVRPVYGTASRVSSWSDSFKSWFVPSTVCSSSFVCFFIVLFSSSTYFVGPGRFQNDLWREYSFVLGLETQCVPHWTCDRFPDRSYRLPRNLCSVSCFFCRSMCSPFVCLLHAVSNMYFVFWSVLNIVLSAVKWWIITHCFSQSPRLSDFATVHGPPLGRSVPTPGPGATWKSPAMPAVCLRICVYLPMVLFLFSTWWSACFAWVKYTLDSFPVDYENYGDRSLVDVLCPLDLSLPLFVHQYSYSVFAFHFSSAHLFVTTARLPYFCFLGSPCVGFENRIPFDSCCYLQDSLESVAAVQRPRALLCHDKVHADPGICFSSDHLCFCDTAVIISTFSAARQFVAAALHMGNQKSKSIITSHSTHGRDARKRVMNQYHTFLAFLTDLSKIQDTVKRTRNLDR